jgi:hypothetical protein
VAQRLFDRVGREARGHGNAQRVQCRRPPRVSRPRKAMGALPWMAVDSSLARGHGVSTARDGPQRPFQFIHSPRSMRPWRVRAGFRMLTQWPTHIDPFGLSGCAACRYQSSSQAVRAAGKQL